MPLSADGHGNREWIAGSGQVIPNNSIQSGQHNFALRRKLCLDCRRYQWSQPGEVLIDQPVNPANAVVNQSGYARRRYFRQCRAPAARFKRNMPMDSFHHVGQTCEGSVAKRPIPTNTLESKTLDGFVITPLPNGSRSSIGDCCTAAYDSAGLQSTGAASRSSREAPGLGTIWALVSFRSTMKDGRVASRSCARKPAAEGR